MKLLPLLTCLILLAGCGSEAKNIARIDAFADFQFGEGFKAVMQKACKLESAEIIEIDDKSFAKEKICSSENFEFQKIANLLDTTKAEGARGFGRRWSSSIRTDNMLSVNGKKIVKGTNFYIRAYPIILAGVWGDDQFKKVQKYKISLRLAWCGLFTQFSGNSSNDGFAKLYSI